MSYKGKFVPRNLNKYVGDVTKIRYLSLWERKFMVYLDSNDKVLRWNSEDFIVQYISPKDGREHRYLVDFFIEIQLPDGTISQKLIEVKPRHECFPPKPGKNTKRYINSVMTYEVNQAKWKAAKKIAEKHGMTFQILTEVELNIK